MRVILKNGDIIATGLNVLFESEGRPVIKFMPDDERQAKGAVRTIDFRDVKRIEP